VVLFQDIIKDDEIKLDWFFKASLINDIVKVNSAICLRTALSLHVSNPRHASLTYLIAKTVCSNCFHSYRFSFDIEYYFIVMLMIGL